MYSKRTESDIEHLTGEDLTNARSENIFNRYVKRSSMVPLPSGTRAHRHTTHLASLDDQYSMVDFLHPPSPLPTNQPKTSQL